MLFRTIASVAFLACASNVAAEPQPYKLVKAPVEGLSLARRSTPGYQPDQSVCGGGGNTCADACGAGYESCPSEDESTHCFNPTVKQSCCFDGTGSMYTQTHSSMSPFQRSVVAKTTTKAAKTTVVAPSSGYSTAWSGSNSTIATAVPTQPSESAPGSAEPSTISSGASLTGVSAMLLAAAGFFALL
ncbi:hypothetical protein FPRO05_01754 [Fusarium proliferatum]|uniref:Prp 4 CRoW domain-containing protein n=1 Tax=Gibberella intermedia TaxID=948311 RepID=A0A365N880_GIBIN|nr:hypothetical protein FPRO05_01754 [Fusarium proliferatum]